MWYIITAVIALVVGYAIGYADKDCPAVCPAKPFVPTPAPATVNAKRKVAKKA